MGMAGRNGCPEIKGSPDKAAPSHVVDRFRDIFGCEVPLREGVGHIPARKGDFGFRHLVSRFDEGAHEHETTADAKRLWQLALVQPGAALGPLYECHYFQYPAESSTRTMLVFVHYQSFEGYAYKGIITAYWVSGNKTCTRQPVP